MGSNFSYLSAIQPPTLPPNWQSLVDSEIPIITTASFHSNSQYLTDQSILESDLIPKYISVFEEKPTFVPKFYQLYKKLVYIYGNLANDTFIKFLRLSKTLILDTKYTNQSVQMGKTFAVMDDAPGLTL